MKVVVEAASPLLKDTEAATLLGVSVYTLRGWRQQKTGPAFVHVGTAVRYARADLDSYLAAHRIGPASVERATASLVDPSAGTGGMVPGSTAADTARQVPVLPAVAVVDAQGAAVGIAAWCPACEQVHRHGAEGSAEPRVTTRGAHCCAEPGAAQLWTSYRLDVRGTVRCEEAVIPSAPMLVPRKVRGLDMRRRPRLWRQLGGVSDKLRAGLRAAMLHTAAGVGAWAHARLPRGGEVSVSLQGSWRVWAPDGAQVSGNSYVSLAAHLYGLPAGVAALRLFEAATGASLDGQAAREIAAAVDAFAARDAAGPGGGL